MLKILYKLHTFIPQTLSMTYPKSIKISIKYSLMTLLNIQLMMSMS